MKKDIEATAVADFWDGRSYVRSDGREVLWGKDMENRRFAVWGRDRGHCVRCGVRVGESFHLHHKIHRGSNGVDRDDRADNLETLCWRCHSQEHP